MLAVKFSRSIVVASLVVAGQIGVETSLQILRNVSAEQESELEQHLAEA